ncbi:MAG: DUF4012 domain-containing protein, partial [Actinobacteria bacterium]|nr:DUF4012 domain-containing protein [Actinomycetota bacterium]
MGVSVSGGGSGSPGPVRERVRVRVQVPRRRRSRRGIRRTLLGLGFLALALTLDAVWVATSIERSLETARVDMLRGAEALIRGDVEGARASFLLARRASEGTLGALRHPAGLLARIVPGLSDDVEAVRAVARAGVLSAEAGEHLVRAADETGWGPDGARILQPGGRVGLEPIERAAPSLEAAAEALERAERLLASTAEMDLLRQVREGAASAREKLAESGSIVRAAADLATLLPSMLGGDEPRRYLLAFQNLSDPRGSGGFVGMYGVLEADAGRLTLLGLNHVRFDPVPPVDAPTEVRRRYAMFGSLSNLHATTAPPDFPTGARLALGVFRASTGRRLDGVVAADAVALGYLLGATGSVETPAWPEAISAENAVEFFSHDVFLLATRESDRTQQDVGEAVWDSVLRNATDPGGLASALSRAARDRHLQVYVRDPGEEALLDRLGASGRLVLGENPLLAVWHGASPGRVGYFLERRVDYAAEIREDGSADVTVRATTENTAPEGPASELLGEGTPGEPVGFFHAYVSVYLPEDAERVRVSVDGKLPIVQLMGREMGHRVVTVLLGAPAGGATSLEVSYRIPGLADAAGPGAHVSIDVVPQPALRPAVYSVELALPPGSRILA